MPKPKTNLRSALRCASPLLAALALLIAPGCAGTATQSGTERTLHGLQRLVGAKNSPVDHLGMIAGANEESPWRLRSDVEGALDLTREALRDLPYARFSNWTEVGGVILVLSSMATEHESSLVRAESMDALARFARWAELSRVEWDWTLSETSVIRALKTLGEAPEFDRTDPAGAFAVAEALGTLTAFPFLLPDRVRQGDDAAALREFTSGLSSARGVLRALSGARLTGFRRDPEVMDALDAGYVSVSATVIRLSFLERALGDPAPITRNGVVRHLAELRPQGAADVLSRAVRRDADPGVRRDAAWALASFPLDGSGAPLIDAISDHAPEVRRAALLSLRKMSGEDFREDRASWQRWLRTALREGGGEDGSPPAPEASDSR